MRQILSHLTFIASLWLFVAAPTHPSKREASPTLSHAELCDFVRDARKPGAARQAVKRFCHAPDIKGYYASTRALSATALL